ncbi:MAG: four helix bundle protein [Selenomonadaceae bacterium]|nr:four helix bundle protein [Selenomonadaceae bacterium]
MSKQKAIELTAEVYRLVEKLPDEELNALSKKLKLSAIEITTNIAKSELDSTLEDKKHFLSAANGKIAVVETLLLICVKVNYFGKEEIETAMTMCAELGRMLNES